MIKYLLTVVTPNDYRMHISTSIHDSYNDLSRELDKLGYTDGEIDKILIGETYEDFESWVRVTKVEL